MFGTALRAPSPTSIRGLFQDDEERTFTDFDRVTVNNRLILLDKGINFFFKDKVIVDIHLADRKTGVIEEILPSPPDTARVKLDSTGQIVPMPFRHMVLTGPGLEVSQIESIYNVRSAFGPGPWRDLPFDRWLDLTLDEWIDITLE